MADAAFYAELRDLAEELSTEFGQAVTVRRKTTTQVTPTGIVTESGYQTTPTVAALLPASYDKDNAEEYKSLAGREIKCIILAAKGMAFIPKSHDEIVVGSDVWDIGSCTPLNPAGTPIYHRCAAVLL